jgi:hypothetical protein
MGFGVFGAICVGGVDGDFIWEIGQMPSLV